MVWINLPIKVDHLYSLEQVFLDSGADCCTGYLGFFVVFLKSKQHQDARIYRTSWKVKTTLNISVLLQKICEEYIFILPYRWWGGVEVQIPLGSVGHSCGKALKGPQGNPQIWLWVFDLPQLSLGPGCGETFMPILSSDQHWMFVGVLVYLPPV